MARGKPVDNGIGSNPFGLGCSWCISKSADYGLGVRAVLLQMYASPAGGKAIQQQAAEQHVPTPHDLGLDRQLPWNEK
jgi:hypothetical protein